MQVMQTVMQVMQTVMHVHMHEFHFPEMSSFRRRVEHDEEDDGNETDEQADADKLENATGDASHHVNEDGDDNKYNNDGHDDSHKQSETVCWCCL